MLVMALILFLLLLSFCYIDLVFDVEVVFHLGQTYHQQCQNNVRIQNHVCFIHINKRHMLITNDYV